MGWFSDAVKQGGDFLKQEADRRKSVIGQSAHIDAQNQVVADFETLALGPYKRREITAAQASQKIDELDRGFTIYTQRLGYQRALNGAADVHRLAVQIIRDLQTASTGGGVVVPPILGGGTVFPASMDYTTLALIGVGAYLLFQNRKVF